MDPTKINDKAASYCTAHPVIPNCLENLKPIVEAAATVCEYDQRNNTNEEDAVKKIDKCVDRKVAAMAKPLLEIYGADDGAAQAEAVPPAPAPGAAPVASTSDEHYWQNQFKLECLKQGKDYNQVSGKCEGAGGGAALADPAAQTSGGSGAFGEIGVKVSYIDISLEKDFCLETSGAKACRSSQEPYPVAPFGVLGYRFNPDFAIRAKVAALLTDKVERGAGGSSDGRSFILQGSAAAVFRLYDQLHLSVGPAFVYLPDDLQLPASFPTNPNLFGGEGELEWCLGRGCIGLGGSYTTSLDPKDATGKVNNVDMKEFYGLGKFHF